MENTIELLWNPNIGERKTCLGTAFQSSYFFLRSLNLKKKQRHVLPKNTPGFCFAVYREIFAPNFFEKER